MNYLRNFSIVLMSFCCLIFIACGNASSGDSDGGDNGGNGVPVTIKVVGYSKTPKVYCWGDDLNFEGQPNQAGIVTISVPYAPDKIQCNVQRADKSWVVTADGVCSDYQLFANDVEITTCTGQTNSSNYQFKVDTDGTVAVSGQDINWLDCTNGDPPPSCDQLDVLAEFSGYETAFPEATPEITCWGEGINGAVTDFDNGQADMTACAGEIVCSIQIAPGVYSPNQAGICQDHVLVINDTTVSSGYLNASGSYNYSFTLNEDSTVTETSEQIPQVDCTNDDPPPSCDQLDVLAEFSGYETAFPEATPEITCWGEGINGAVTDFDNGQADMTACAGEMICSIQIAPGVYSPNQAGICQDHLLIINDTTVSSGYLNASGSYNYSFVLNEDGSVEETSEQLPQVDCTVDPPPIDPPPDISCDLEVIYLGTYLDPVIYMDGGGVIWGDTFEVWVDAVDENGDPLTDINGDTISDTNGDPGLMLTVVDVYPDDFIVNMDMTGSLQTWLVYRAILPGENLYINGVLLDQLVPNGVGSNNLIFTLNEACEVVTEDTEEVDIIIDLP